MIPEVNRLAKYNKYLLMQDGARAHTAKLILEMLIDKKKFLLLQPHHWLLNSPDLNPVDFVIWRLLFQNVHRGCRITDLDSLKKAIDKEYSLINILTYSNLDFYV